MAFCERSLVLAVAVGAWSYVAATPASAQQGLITGSVTDSVGGQPITDVEVTVRSEAGEAVAVVRTDAAGLYHVSPLPPGNYSIRFEAPGWELAERDAEVAPDANTELSVRLTPRFFRLPGVSTVAREYEPLLEAPASVSVLDRSDLDRRPQLTMLEQIRTLPGLDIIRTGLVEGQMIPRGFSRLFNARVLLLTDGRIAQIPGARANLPSQIPATSLDLDRIELVRGPASALYGPDAADGVLQIFTKSPFDDPGMTFALSGGVREQGPVEGYPASAAGLVQLEGRIAAAPSDHWAVKVSGRWLRGTEWRHQDSVEVANRVRAEACLADLSDANPSCSGFGPDPDRARLSRIGRRDFSVEHGTLDARVDWIPNERTELTASSGLAWTGDLIVLPGGGATQVTGSRLRYGQLRLRVDELSVQAYVTQGSLDDGYLLRQGFPIRAKSTFAAAQLQHRLALSGRQRLMYGVDAQFTLPDSVEGAPDRARDIRIVGAFLQSETDLSRRWKLVAAGRVDRHSVLPEAIVSPRAAVIFTAAPGHALRATFNRAFTTPLPTFLFQDQEVGHIPLGGPFGYTRWSQGSGGNGFPFEYIDGRPAMKSPLAPLVGQADTMFLPSTTEQLYLLAQEYLRSIGSSYADVMDAAGPPPTEADVGVQLMMFKPGEGFEPFPGGFAAIRDVPPLREESTTSVELGYNGLLRDRALLSVDAYYTKKGAFAGPFQAVTPHLYLDGEALVAFLTSRGVDEATAQSAASEISRLPLGVVTPRGTTPPGPTHLVTPFNYGDVHLFGADLSLDLHLNREWSTAWALSVVSDDAFDADGLDVKLNASTLKWSGSLTYRGTSGLDVSAQYRFTKGYPVGSLVFNGEVDDASVVDVGVGYRLPGSTPLRLQVDVQNLFDVGYRTFVGAPELGRLTIVRGVWGL